MDWLRHFVLIDMHFFALKIDNIAVVISFFHLKSFLDPPETAMDQTEHIYDNRYNIIFSRGIPTTGG